VNNRFADKGGAKQLDKVLKLAKKKIRDGV